MKYQAEFEQNHGEDSDQLHKPVESEDEQEYETFPSYKSGEAIKFQLGMFFNSKELIRDVINEYAMESKKVVFLKKNDGKMVVVKCIVGCKFYMRLSKRVGNQFLQVVSLIDDHTCHRTPKNRQAKTEWLANKFAHILRHNSDMKPLGLQAESMDIWGVKFPFDQAYRAKRKSIESIHGVGRDRFTHLRSYTQELLNSNPNNIVVI